MGSYNARDTADLHNKHYTTSETYEIPVSPLGYVGSCVSWPHFRDVAKAAQLPFPVPLLPLRTFRDIPRVARAVTGRDD